MKLGRIHEFAKLKYHGFHGCGNIWSLVLKCKEDKKGVFEKKGDIDTVYVWVSNSEYNEEDYNYYSEDNMFELIPIKSSEPILVGQYYGTDFYIRPELTTGTYTDETSALEYIPCLLQFHEIITDLK